MQVQAPLSEAPRHVFPLLDLPRELQEMIFDATAGVIAGDDYPRRRHLENRMVVCSHRQNRIFIDARPERNRSWARVVDHPAMRASKLLVHALFPYLLDRGISHALPCPCILGQDTCVFSHYDQGDPLLEVTPSHSRYVDNLNLFEYHLPLLTSESKALVCFGMLSLEALKSLRSINVPNITIDASYADLGIGRIMDILGFISSHLVTSQRLVVLGECLERRTLWLALSARETVLLAAQVANEAAAKAAMAGLPVPELHFSRSFVPYSVSMSFAHGAPRPQPPLEGLPWM